MELSPALLISFLASLITASHALRPLLPLPINLLRPLRGSGGHPANGVSCESWRFAVETNNIRDWKTVPATCEQYVGNYMLGDRYREDSIAVTSEAIAYAESLKLKGDGNDVWVFDVDETVISNLPYYAQHGFGAEEYNGELFTKWLMEAAAPALPESLKLYDKLLSLGIKVIFLTGRREFKRSATALNLKNAGYHTWEKLLLKNASEHSTISFKSRERQKLVDQGYKIVGNIGDQWSDILGPAEGDRTFKLPDPMYYVS